MGFPMIMMDSEKSDIRVETWGAGKKTGRVGDRRKKKSSPMKKLSLGDMRWDLEKKRKATMYRSEDSGARKQSAGRRVGKHFPSPMEKLSLSEVCFLGGSIFRRTKKKFPDEKVFHGISLAGLRKKFGRDSVSEWRHGTARENLAGSAIGGGRPPTREILGLKKKSSLQGLAGEVLTICKRGCFASEDWRGVNVAEHGFGTSRFAVIVVTGARRAPAPSERLRR